MTVLGVILYLAGVLGICNAMSAVEARGFPVILKRWWGASTAICAGLMVLGAWCVAAGM